VTFEQIKAEIERLGWKVIAQKKHAHGVSYDATNYKRLAKGEVSADPVRALVSCLGMVQSYARSDPA
jgi:hypothetical protein